MAKIDKKKAKSEENVSQKLPKINQKREKIKEYQEKKWAKNWLKKWPKMTKAEKELRKIDERNE